MNADSSEEYIGFDEMLMLAADETPKERIPEFKVYLIMLSIKWAVDTRCLLATWGDKNYIDRSSSILEADKRDLFDQSVWHQESGSLF